MTVIQRTEQYIQRQSIEPLEYCQRQLEGNLGIIAATVQVLDENKGHENELLVHKLVQLFNKSVLIRNREYIKQRDQGGNSLGCTPPLLQSGGRPKYRIPREQMKEFTLTVLHGLISLISFT